jgi:hypothetical protein
MTRAAAHAAAVAQLMLIVPVYLICLGDNLGTRSATSEEFLERRDPAAVAFIADWVAALVDDPAQLPGPVSSRLERQPGYTKSKTQQIL